jgi:acetolactate synthase-1/3 small subunit
MLQLISLLLENKPGALMRVTGLLTARGYNIESLTVARTLDPELSRMSIVVDIEPNQRGQLIKQMNKLINVLQASDVTESSAVRRELVLLRVRADMQHRASIDVMRAYGDIEVTRSGLVAVSLEQKKLKLAPPVNKVPPVNKEEVLQNG